MGSVRCDNISPREKMTNSLTTTRWSHQDLGIRVNSTITQIRINPNTSLNYTRIPTNHGLSFLRGKIRIPFAVLMEIMSFDLNSGTALFSQGSSDEEVRKPHIMPG
jgi:hypothetical protein